MAPDPTPHDFANAMQGGRCRHQAGETKPDRIDPLADIEADNIGEPPVERRHRVPEIRLGAANAGMTAADRPVSAFVPAHNRAILRRRRPFAPHLVKAVALTMRLVAPGFDILAGLEMRAPLAIVVDRFAVSKHRTAEVIERPPARQP